MGGVELVWEFWFSWKVRLLYKKKHPHTFQSCTVITFGGFNMPSPGWQPLQVSQRWKHPAIVLVSQGHKIYMLHLDKLPFLSGLNLLHHIGLGICVIMFGICYATKPDNPDTICPECTWTWRARPRTHDKLQKHYTLFILTLGNTASQVVFGPVWVVCVCKTEKGYVQECARWPSLTLFKDSLWGLQEVKPKQLQLCSNSRCLFLLTHVILSFPHISLPSLLPNPLPLSLTHTQILCFH